jgi:hypothetical protein
LGVLGVIDSMIEGILADLKVNHIGIIITIGIKKEMERDKGNEFVYDKIQGVWVCFIWDELMHVYREYITKEGRATASKLGFNHICYDVDSSTALKRLHKLILQKRVGIRLTLPEKSPTVQCNVVSFYKIFGLGIVEFNIVNENV